MNKFPTTILITLHNTGRELMLITEDMGTLTEEEQLKVDISNKTNEDNCLITIKEFNTAKELNIFLKTVRESFIYNRLGKLTKEDIRRQVKQSNISIEQRISFGIGQLVLNPETDNIVRTVGYKTSNGVKDYMDSISLQLVYKNQVQYYLCTKRFDDEEALIEYYEHIYTKWVKSLKFVKPEKVKELK